MLLKCYLSRYFFYLILRENSKNYFHTEEKIVQHRIHILPFNIYRLNCNTFHTRKTSTKSTSRTKSEKVPESSDSYLYREERRSRPVYAVRSHLSGKRERVIACETVGRVQRRRRLYIAGGDCVHAGARLRLRQRNTLRPARGRETYICVFCSEREGGGSAALTSSVCDRPTIKRRPPARRGERSHVRRFASVRPPRGAFLVTHDTRRAVECCVGCDRAIHF